MKSQQSGQEVNVIEGCLFGFVLAAWLLGAAAFSALCGLPVAVSL